MQCIVTQANSDEKVLLSGVEPKTLRLLVWMLVLTTTDLQETCGSLNYNYKAIKTSKQKVLGRLLIGALGFPFLSVSLSTLH